MRERDIWQTILDQPEDEIVSLVIVIASAGSSPGKKGFKMVVGHQGRLAGTIGGGIMEKRIIDAIVTTPNNGHNRKQRLDHRKDSKYASGLNCSGWQEIVIASIGPSDRNIIRKILESYQTPTSPQLSILTSGITLDQVSQTDLLYQEVVAQPHRVYIFGGGHVGTAIAQQLVLLDFDVTVFDPRQEILAFHHPARNYQFKSGPLVDLQREIIEGDHTYLIITSNSIDNDIEALRFCLQKQVCYIGFMGSQTKIKMAKHRLQSDLEEVHAPIGIKLPNQTPAEIAVSVAAELITIKNS